MKQKIYELCLEIEKLPASEQATKCVILAENLKGIFDAAVAKAVRERTREVYEWSLLEDINKKTFWLRRYPECFVIKEDTP